MYRIVLFLLFLLAGCTLPTTQQTEEALFDGPPVVTIASPLPNTTYAENVSVNIQATISNAGQDISRVDVAVDDAVVAALQSPNAGGASTFSITQTWPTEGTGEHRIRVTAYRGDGTASEPAEVTVNVVESNQQAPATEVEQAAPTETDEPYEAEDETQPTDTPAEEQPSTAIPEPTPESATATPSVPTARFINAINVRSGPGTNFNPPIGQFAANQSAEILALNLNDTWLKVRYGSGEGWVFTSLVEIVGDTRGLPREAGPPTPVPPTATPIPATATPSLTNNLVPVEPFINPAQPQCGQTFTVGMSIRNDGSGSLSTGTSRIRVIRASDGTEIASSGAALVPVQLASGGTHRVEFQFTIDVYVNEVHRVEFIADADNQVPETIENDNRITVDYTLPPCP